MIDIHSHILPGMDDGSSSLEESLAMARESARQGVRLLAATPHFYATQEDPNSFLRRREKSLALLESAWQEGFPTLLVGAEVRYFDGISRVEKIAHLTLDHTRILLLEMPFTSWSRRMVEEVVELQRSRGLQVLLAHVERYMKDQDSQVWETFRQNGVWMQCNANFFLRWQTKRKAQALFKKGEIHMLGSDTHNMTTRPPNMALAREALIKAAGERAWRNFERNSYTLLKAGMVP